MSRDTLLANCKIQGQDPEIYLTAVIKRLPHNATAEQAAELTPARFATTLRARGRKSPDKCPDGPAAGDAFGVLSK